METVTEQLFGVHSAIHLLFEAAARRSPDAVALVFEDKRLTYSDSNARANRIASLLIQQGVAPDVRVGLNLHRGLDLIVGLLGILKAGGAYVLFRPGAMPRERLDCMISDSAIKRSRRYGLRNRTK